MEKEYLISHYSRGLDADGDIDDHLPFVFIHSSEI
jgi:hypothetical protein